MNKAPVLSCCITYGFETSDSFSIARLLERMLGVNFDMSDRPDMGGRVYEFKSWTVNIGTLESVLLCPNYVDGFGWKEPAFKNCLLLSEIFWQTTNLLDLGQLAAAIDVYNDAPIQVVHYQVIGNMFGDGVIHQLRREFSPYERALHWNSHFKMKEDAFDNEASKPEDEKCG